MHRTLHIDILFDLVQLRAKIHSLGHCLQTNMFLVTSTLVCTGFIDNINILSYLSLTCMLFSLHGELAGDI